MSFGYPIPAAPPDKQKAVERLVCRRLAAEQRDAEADTGLRSEATARQVSVWEREIDELVYALCGLTPAEVQIVEGAG